jgi:glycosyltransferase involved in cell wall biosynthesis
MMMSFLNEAFTVASYRELCATDLRTAKPLVSVIIPVFNRPKELASALRSVSAQTFSDWEVIVVDDASSDASSEVAFQVGPAGKVRVIRHEKNEGPSTARNSGISAARGRYVSFLDSDDSWHPEKLRKQVEMVEAEPDPDMVFCATQTVVYRDGRRVRVAPKREPLAGEPWSEFLYVNGGSAQTNSFLLSRELAMKIGFQPPHEDHLFFLTAGALGARYRLVAEPLSNWNDDRRADRLSLDESLKRSRTYLNDARGMMTERARLAFEVRHLGPMLLKDSPIQTIKLFNRAVIEGAVLRRHLLGVCTRCLFPPPAVAVLRRIFPESAN